MVPLAGLMEMVLRFAAFTVSVEFALIPPKLPVMVVLPIFLAEESPLTVMEATLAAEDSIASLRLHPGCCHPRTPRRGELLIHIQRQGRIDWCDCEIRHGCRTTVLVMFSVPF